MSRNAAPTRKSSDTDRLQQELLDAQRELVRLQDRLDVQLTQASRVRVGDDEDDEPDAHATHVPATSVAAVDPEADARIARIQALEAQVAALTASRAAEQSANAKLVRDLQDEVEVLRNNSGAGRAADGDDRAGTSLADELGAVDALEACCCFVVVWVFTCVCERKPTCR